jgi:hypothetical protein
MKNLNKVLITLALTIPTISFAALSGFQGLLTDFHGLLDTVLKIVFGLAMIFFFWGIAQFILNDAGNDKTREDGKKKILWGIVAIFVMVTIYGILKFISTLTGITP